MQDFCLRSGREDLLAQWNSRANLPLTPDSVSRSGMQKVWWRCERGHEWQAQVRSRVDGSGCPVCANRVVIVGKNDLASKYPLLAKEWHPSKNGVLTPQAVTFGTKRKVWWQCAKGHEWIASVQSRTLDGTGCPVCAGRVVISGDNDLASWFPEVAEEWHPTLNGDLLPTQVAPFCKRRVWWKCPHGHTYAATVDMRTIRHSGCPFCAGKRVLAGFNDLATTEPDIAAQWHDELNGELTPQSITAGSHKKVWWKCAEGHVWRASVYSRTGKQRRGCPVCAGVAVGKRKRRYERMLEEVAEVMRV